MHNLEWPEILEIDAAVMLSITGGLAVVLMAGEARPELVAPLMVVIQAGLALFVVGLVGEVLMARRQKHN